MSNNVQQVYGIHPVMELFDSDQIIDRIYIDKQAKSAGVDEIRNKARELEIPVAFVPNYKLDKFTRKNHQGVVALISPIEFSEISEIVTRCFEEGRQPFVLALDGITDVRNFGAIARTAECAGVDALLVPEKDSAPIHDDAIRTSAGALTRIPVCREKNFRGAIEDLQNYGLKILACSEKGKDNLYKADLSEACAVVMGAEDKGISSDILRIADEMVFIPMKGQTASLNVSVAAGIALFEVLRQRDV